MFLRRVAFGKFFFVLSNATSGSSQFHIVRKLFSVQL